MNLSDRIIEVCVGRGKTGQARTGTPRYLFTDAYDQRDKLARLLRPYWSRLVDAPPFAEWFARSLTNILGLCNPDTAVTQLSLPDGERLYLVDTDLLARQTHGLASCESAVRSIEKEPSTERKRP